jgi:hypothetical protein
VTLDPWRSDFATVVLSMANLPVPASAARTELSVLHDGVRFEQAGLTSAPPGAQVSHAFSYPPVQAATRLVWRQAVSFGTSTRDGSQLLVRSPTASPAAATFDYASEALPRVSALRGSIAPGGSPQLSWQGAQGEPWPASVDGLGAHAEWINPSSAKIRWNLLGPIEQATTQSFPRIPEPIMGVRGVRATEVEPAIYVVDADHMSGYDDFRRAGQELFESTLPAADLRARISLAGTLR